MTFGSWFGLGDFGAVRGKKAAKKRALSKKTGKKSTPRMVQTRKVPKRVYPRKRAAAAGPGTHPWWLYGAEPYAPGGYSRHTPGNGSWVRAGRGGGFVPAEVGPGAAAVTIGHSTPHTRTVCGCKVVRMKNKREAIKCEGAGPKGGAMHRFAKDAEIARAKAAVAAGGDICTHIPVFGRRGPLSPEAKAARAAKSRVMFRTSRGRVVALRRPSARRLKDYVSYYYHRLDRQNKARGRKLHYMPSFADINGAYGNSDW